MNFKTPYSKPYLLACNMIPVVFDESRKITITIPSLQETFENENINIFCNLLVSGLAEKKKFNLLFDAESSLGLILGLLKNNLFPEVCKVLFSYVEGINYSNRLLIGEKPVTAEEFDVIKKIFLTGCGFNDYEYLNAVDKEEDDLDDFSKAIKSRINSYNSKVGNIKGNDNKIDIQTMMIGIAHYFPSYTFEVIMKSTPFVFKTLSYWASTLESQHMLEIAAVNGAAKNYKPLFNRGE